MTISGSGRLDIAPGVVAIDPSELPPIPDDVLTNPESARVDIRSWFAQPERPLEIEIGSGKGTFLVQQAELSPEVNYLGIEWAGEYFAHAADRVRRRGLTNVRLLCADAVSFLRWRVPDGVARVIHLYFSDPWPKRKHHKNRVVRDEFLGEAWRVLRPPCEGEPGGELRIVTDHDGYWAWMEEHFARWVEGSHGVREPRSHGGSEARSREEIWNGGSVGGGCARRFERLAFDAPASARRGELVGTNFERKFREQGRSFHAVTLRRLG